MNKRRKTWMIFASCLLLSGCTMFAAAMAVQDWDFNLLKEETMKTETFPIKEDFQAVAIRSSTENIDFRLSEDGSCRVVCQEKRKEAHSVSVKAGTLTIERKKKNWNDFLSFFSFGTPSITVHLPRRESDSLFIEESTGDISLPREFVFGSIEILLSTGDVDLAASSEGRIQVRTSTGQIRMTDVSAGELDLSASTGHMDLQSIRCEGDLSLSLSTGKAKLTDVSCGRLSSSGSTGSISLTDVLAKEDISIRRSTGHVTFDHCDGAELSIDTDTGTVSGSLLSPKVFTARSDTGRISVPETVSGGKCRITTSTGDIRIQVLDE